MTYSLIGSLNSLSCIHFVDFGKNEDCFGKISCSQKGNNDNKSLETQLKVFRKDNGGGQFRKHQQIYLGKSQLNQHQRFRNKIAVAVADFEKDENLQPLVTSPLLRDTHEQNRHVQKAITNVDRCKRKLNATIRKYDIQKPQKHTNRFC